MVRFAHIADCHLGCWRQEELQSLNFESFKRAVERSLEERVDFILIAGDLFDSAYPSIEVLKDCFSVLKNVKDSGIPVYLIAGSHDYSTAGKTFLDVLERAGFCKNVTSYEVEEDGRIKLFPFFHKDIAIYGYPGKKSGMEIEELKRVYFDSLNPFTIFMLHTTIKDVVGTIPMDSIEKEKLPLANYYAFGHIHKRYDSQIGNSTFVYPGPTFPANFQELSDLKTGSFCFVELVNGVLKMKRELIPLKEVVNFEIEIENGLTATQEIISKLDQSNLKDKIVLLKLKGTLKTGKTGDISFNEIEDFVRKKEAYSFIRNISFLKISETLFEEGDSGEDNVEEIERKILNEYSIKNPGNLFNKHLGEFMNILSIEKAEEEKSSVFEERLLSELRNTLEIKGAF